MNIRLTTLLCISAGLFQIELCGQSEVYFERATSPLDINGDGSTNVTDVLLVLSAFGTVCN